MDTSRFDAHPQQRRPLSSSRAARDGSDQSESSNYVSNVILTIDLILKHTQADAYGHGAEQCARASLAGGASEFAVARVDEALQLREQNIVQVRLCAFRSLLTRNWCSRCWFWALRRTPQ
jgi:hypothetical protein